MVWPRQDAFWCSLMFRIRLQPTLNEPSAPELVTQRRNRIECRNRLGSRATWGVTLSLIKSRWVLLSLNQECCSISNESFPNIGARHCQPRDITQSISTVVWGSYNGCDDRVIRFVFSERRRGVVWATHKQRSLTARSNQISTNRTIRLITFFRSHGPTQTFY